MALAIRGYLAGALICSACFVSTPVIAAEGPDEAKTLEAVWLLIGGEGGNPSAHALHFDGCEAADQEGHIYRCKVDEGGAPTTYLLSPDPKYRWVASRPNR